MTLEPRRPPKALRPLLAPLGGGAALLLALAPSGCALTDVTIQPPAAGHVLAPSLVGHGREVVVNAPFADLRVARDRCGMKKNGYNWDTADVHCGVEATDWVTGALVDGLASSGFHVLLNQPAASLSTPRIDGEVVQFFVEPKLDAFEFTPEADIAVTLHVTTPSGLLADRRFYFKGGEPRWIGFDDTFQDAAEAATKKAVAGMVAAIVELLDRYPGLGASAPPAAVSMSTAVRP